MAKKEDAENAKEKKRSRLGKISGSVLKWTFRFAVIGVGFGIGSEIISEFLVGGVIHSTDPTGEYLLGVSKKFMEPIMSGVTNYLTADGAIPIHEAMKPLVRTLETIHGWLGIEGAFDIAEHGGIGEEIAKAGGEELSTTKTSAGQHDFSSGFGNAFGSGPSPSPSM